MRLFLLLLIILSAPTISAQKIITGVVLNSETQEPLPYATVQLSPENETLTNIDGTFQLNTQTQDSTFTVSYIGFYSQQISLSSEKENYEIQLLPREEMLNEVVLYSGKDPANELIKKAIEKKSINDPERRLKSYQFKSYNKFIIDNQDRGFRVETDTSNLDIKTIINQGRSYLSEKVSTHLYEAPGSQLEIVEGIKTAGFKKPVYDILSLDVQAFSLYREDYVIFKTDYAGPLSKNALKNYSYKVLDTVTNENRPAFVIYFKPKREKTVAGLEGILYLDTVSFAIQKARAQLLGAVELEINHFYDFYENENIWFPSNQSVTLKPGKGGKDISVFGGSISVGTLQRQKSILNDFLSTGEVEENLYLTSKTTYYDRKFNLELNLKKSQPAIYVPEDASRKSVNFWEGNRQEPFTLEDEFTALRVERMIRMRDIERKIEVKKAISNGYYPIGAIDFDLGQFVNYNKYEGIRLGIGGKTNPNFSTKFRLEGHVAYGFKDREFKYGLGAGALLNQRTGTWFNAKYSKGIREIASHNYIQGINEFSILRPRFANIDYFYRHKTFQTSVEHRLAPNINTELMVSTSDISQIEDYAFLNNGKVYRDFTISEAKIGILWRPFSKFVNTPESHAVVAKGYPQFTGQISQSFADFLGGDFNFTKIGLKAEYQINRINQSSTKFTLGGNQSFGDIPLTQAFHASPNQPNSPDIPGRFSVAGGLVFETMFFNEFFSERQVALHMRHTFRPISITEKIRPEFSIISRHVIGDFKNMAPHQNIEFKSLKEGFSEAGLELSKIYAGFGLSVAYRYGAYHLPTFKENFAFKFTFSLTL
ncbi:DUF5686 and carboxypeptidase-like regulatory domain-containing protein [Gillisia limnaea]|uniref:Carboxypeptidase-like regulatory domain-containing protein n=1 Tax=Gillisia limnaea (strain DSM 15749 / LMG 21470 / R-8282) TaxID=865937 RepID=H2BX78_GILLR|nr:DUF5686 and carboxypeptidase-like regulatory domain-containing protein [Gillisia limnaea]EHQ03068.1 hypothetical protein Gilli_2442 [Gillisia limnaea DSM 15749]